jgi:hypothetical protein
VCEQLDEEERERDCADARRDRRPAGAPAGVDDADRQDDGGPDDDAELELDRREEVERSHSPFVSKA